MIRKLLRRIGFVHRTQVADMARAYAAARVSRLTSDWIVSSLAPNEEVRGGIKTIRERARQEERDNDHVRRYLRIQEKNVVGSAGARLQAQVADANGKPDTAANSIIEAGWAEWGTRGVCTADGALSWLGAQRLLVRTVKRDGEAFVRRLRGWNGNRFGYAIQFLEPDLIDHEYDADIGDGRRVRMGIEVDAWGRELAFHAFERHPGDTRNYRPGQRVRVPASDMLHCYIQERTGQVRAVSPMSSALRRLRMLAGYEEAELVAARAAACKTGYYQTGVDYEGDSKDVDGSWLEAAEPGSVKLLPRGVEFKPNDPQHPTAQYGEFLKSILRAASAGLDVSYMRMTGDLSEANYSSMRVGHLDDNDGYAMDQQELLLEQFNEPIYLDWLEMGLTAGALSPLPLTRFEKFVPHSWQPRVWQGVDPKKEADADAIAEDRRWVSPRHNAARRGYDREDVYKELAADADLAKNYKQQPRVAPLAPDQTGGNTSEQGA